MLNVNDDSVPGACGALGNSRSVSQINSGDQIASKVSRNGRCVGVIAVLLAMISAPRLVHAGDLTTDVTFAVALRDLAADAFESRRDVLLRDTFPGRPFYIPALRARQIAVDIQASMIVVGFGNEMTTAVERVLKVGGFSVPANIVGIIKDFATSPNSAALFKKNSIRGLELALDKYLASKGIAQGARDKLIKEALIESMKKVHADMKAGKMKITRSSQPSSCKGGKETATVDVDLAKGLVTYRVDATGCQCNDSDSLKSYHAEIVGTIGSSVDLKAKAIKWRFHLKRARYWGEPCSDKYNKAVENWKKVYFPSKPSNHAASPVAADPCEGVNPNSLIEMIAANEGMIKRLLCRKIKLKADKQEDSDEYDRVKERVERLGATQDALLKQYIECRFGGTAGQVPPRLFREVIVRCPSGRYINPPLTEVAKTCDEEPNKPKGHAIASSLFAGSLGGWALQGDGYDLKAKADYIFAKDRGKGDFWYFKAPAKYLGDKSGVYGYGMTFELNQLESGGPTFQWEIVRISDGTTDLIHNNAKASGGWVEFTVPFVESAWIHPKTMKVATKEELQRVLTNLKSLLINCEHSSDHDTGGLRNVVMFGP